MSNSIFKLGLGSPLFTNIVKLKQLINETRLVNMFYPIPNGKLQDFWIRSFLSYDLYPPVCLV